MLRLVFVGLIQAILGSICDILGFDGTINLSELRVNHPILGCIMHDVEEP